MDKERDDIKQRLEEELRPVTFSSHDAVLRQTHPPTLRAILRALWNKELEIPLRPLGAAAAVLITGVLIVYSPLPGTREQQAGPQPRQRELLETGGNTYWKDIYEQAVKRHEN